MIIELYGLPGSGKSTLAKELEENSEAVVVRRLKVNRLIVFYRAIKFLIHHPIIGFKNLWFIVKNAEYIHDVWNNFFMRYAKYMTAKRLSKRGVIVVLDEGPHQNLLSVPQKSLDQAKVNTILCKLPPTDTCVCFDLPSDVRDEHIKKRGYRSRPEYSDNQYNQFIKYLEFTNDKVVKLLKKKQNVLMIEDLDTRDRVTNELLETISKD